MQVSLSSYLNNPLQLRAEASSLRDKGDLKGASSLLLSGLTRFPHELDQYGHPTFRKELMRLLLSDREWDAAAKLIPVAGGPGGDHWYTILFARAYSEAGDAERAAHWHNLTTRLYPAALGSKVTHSARRANKVIERLQLDKYLEIGVWKGDTFFSVDSVYRTGVDPGFLFDVAKHTDSKTRLIASSSDDFFSKLELSEKFDVIFLDGLHTFEQTYRDFLNTLQHAHPSTVWIIDDTLPSDIYSSLRDQAVSLSARKEAGLSGSAWHGDVFKTIVTIHDFHQGFDYRTIVGSGNPQTLLWQSRSFRRAPLFNSFEAISRLDYFNLLRNQSLLRCAEEEVSIDECVSYLGK
jgi:hypothetical protein